MEIPDGWVESDALTLPYIMYIVTLTLNFKGDFDAREKNDIASVFFTISPLIMVRFQTFKNWHTAEDFLYHTVIHLACFGVLGA